MNKYKMEIYREEEKNIYILEQNMNKYEQYSSAQLIIFNPLLISIF